MATDHPDYHDVDIILRLYDLRREAVMRKSRDSLFREFLRMSDDAAYGVIFTPDHPLNVCYRQVSSYWEMAAGFVKHGVLHAGLFAENCGEGLFVFAKVQPILARLRQNAPVAFQNLEWFVTNCAEARKRLEMVQSRLKSMK